MAHDLPQAEPPQPELVLICDHRGRILDLPRRPPGLAAGPGDTLAPLVTGGSASRALDLLLSLRREGAVFLSPLELRLGGRAVTFLFAGVTGPAASLLIGSRHRRRLAAFCRHLARSSPAEAGGAPFGLELDPPAVERLGDLLQRRGAGAGRTPRSATARARLLRSLARRLAAADLPGEAGRLAAALDHHARRLAEEPEGAG